MDKKTNAHFNRPLMSVLKLFKVKLPSVNISTFMSEKKRTQSKIMFLGAVTAKLLFRGNLVLPVGPTKRVRLCEGTRGKGDPSWLL